MKNKMDELIKELEEWFKKWYSYSWDEAPPLKHILEVKNILRKMKKIKRIRNEKIIKESNQKMS